ncbi:PD-(D/E)XK nuclease-like domain-containing protein [Sphingomonas cannabina]|uniref:PD-(D/E)XK nuclease-like domain-containing protein n=1 Tax=Sphingomonas cannabina TaxID=2899123 RepID=UPI001F1A327E|nr:PD-(D/E)XK nuclease-like domain-containing protein [Sphingomonas cannabina]UIJ43760.1 PD-(D/E)XK nuclease-like domain-containing protein [Sphingomonas cannabina]
MTRRDYEGAIEREVERWPGVTVRFEEGGKHPRAVFRFGEVEQFRPYPSSPSDQRGLDMKITEVRRLLKDMGAVLMPRPKATGPKRERNPGADQRELPVGEPAPVKPDPWAALREVRCSPIITAPGAYPNIDAEDYHRNPDLLPAPSLSSTGAKTLLNKSPYHFWFDSPMNPDRPPEEGKPHFSIGKAAHDMLLLSERWPEHYHVLPEDYRAPSQRTVNFTDDQLAAIDAEQAGKTILRHADAEAVCAVAAAIRRNGLAMATLTNGVTEETLAWQDPETGVWLRARPDFRPNSIVEHRDVMVVSDLKFVAPTNASPDGFKRAIANFGYHQSAAFYADGIKAVYGHYPTHWVHVVVEKEPPYCVALYELPAEDIERGRWLNRQAIRKFAECLSADRWPGYADEPAQVGLPVWARKRIDDIEGHEMAWAAAA